LFRTTPPKSLPILDIIKHYSNSINHYSITPKHSPISPLTLSYGDNIEDRIKSRLGWGLVADVHSTTYELRVGILQSKLEQMNIHLAQNFIDFLAAKITSNVRELEGALNKVIAHSTLIRDKS